MSKLSDKAKVINLEDDEDAPQALMWPDRPRTAIGAISASLAMGRGIEAENRELRSRLQRFEDATVVELLDPKHIKASRFANRHELSFVGPEFEALKAEIQTAGVNVQPIKVRPAAQGGGQVGEGAGVYEIVFGHRRHRACLELGLPVAAIVANLSDSRLFAEMDRENRERKNLSPWEQGVMYKRALDEGLFTSARQLAIAVGAASGNVSSAIQLACLPDEVLQAFPTPLDLQYRWVAPLTAALQSDREAVIGRAREVAAMSVKPSAKEVLRRLLDTGHTRESAANSASELIADSTGKVLGFWDRDSRGGVTLQLKAGSLSQAKEKRLREFVENLLA